MQNKLWVGSFDFSRHCTWLGFGLWVGGAVFGGGLGAIIGALCGYTIILIDKQSISHYKKTAIIGLTIITGIFVYITLSLYYS